jgi:hypothetical protein
MTHSGYDWNNRLAILEARLAALPADAPATERQRLQDAAAATRVGAVVWRAEYERHVEEVRANHRVKAEERKRPREPLSK